MMIQPGDILYGFCGGYFGRDSYGEKIVMGVGRDWIVARDMTMGCYVLAQGDDVIDVVLELSKNED